MILMLPLVNNLSGCFEETRARKPSLYVWIEGFNALEIPAEHPQYEDVMKVYAQQRIRWIESE